MTYAQAKQAIIATGTVPADVYGDNREHVEFAFDAASQRVLIVTKSGFFGAVIPNAIDKAEALWLLKNHPTATRIYTLDKP